jgi:hypothetical protein
MPHSATIRTNATSIEAMLRSALAGPHDGLQAFDLAMSELVGQKAPHTVSSAMKAEAAAAILELVTSGQLDVVELARCAVRRANEVGLRLQRAV